MAQYYLIHRFHQADSLQYNNRLFSTENEVMSRACLLIGAGELGNFLIEDEDGRVVAETLRSRAAARRRRVRRPTRLLCGMLAGPRPLGGTLGWL